MKKVTRIFKILILLIFCSPALYAQVTKAKAGTGVYENLINLSTAKPLIKVAVSGKGAVLTFPDNKNYFLSSHAIRQISAPELQKIKTTTQKTALISADIKNVSSTRMLWQNKRTENMIELPADLPDGTYELNAKVYEKAGPGLKGTLKTNVRINFVKDKGYITVIMEESLVL